MESNILAWHSETSKLNNVELRTAQNMPQSGFSKLQRIQTAVNGYREIDHITLVVKSLHWHPVEKRIDYKALLLVYRALHDIKEYMREN